MFTEGLDPSALQWVRQTYRPDEARGQAASSPDNEQESSDFSGESSTGSFQVPLIPSIWDTSGIVEEQRYGMDSPPGKIPSPTAPPCMSHNDIREVSDSFESMSYPVVEPFSCDIEREQSERVESSVYEGSSVRVEQPLEIPDVISTADTSTRPEVQKRPPLPSLSGQAVWPAIIAYEACVRLCLGAWARRSSAEAPEFLQDECLLLRTSFGLQQVLLQPKDEDLANGLHEDGDSASGSKPKIKVKVQVRKVKLMRIPSGCQFPSFTRTFSSVYSFGKRSNKWSGWAAVRKIRVIPRASLRMNANVALNTGTQYLKQVSGILKAGVNSLRSIENQETFCVLKTRSSLGNEVARVQSGSCDTTSFNLDVSTDDLLVEVYDAQGSLLGCSSVQLSGVDDPNERVRWWPIFSEPDRERVGSVQLFISYATVSSELGPGKWNVVGANAAYDSVFAAAINFHQFGKRNLRLTRPWEWLLSEFAGCYGVSVNYCKLRYLACVMDAATPTEDCLSLIYELLLPIVAARDEDQLNRQERRMYSEVEQQVSKLLVLVFENYKSLDETLPFGIVDVYQAPSGDVAPCLEPAIKVFTLLKDILTASSQETLRSHFQTAAKKRCKRLMADTDEFVTPSNEGLLADPITFSTAYMKMKSLCANVMAEIEADIAIHNLQVLPSFIDLPNITSSIYNVEVRKRLSAFLVSCPPTGPSSPVVELLIATADFQRDLASWRLKPVKEGVDAKDLFHLYILLWIQDKRLQLLEFCKLEKVRLAGVQTQQWTAPFVEDIYEKMKETLNEYEVIISRWPEYTVSLETAIAEVERALIATLEKLFADVLAPLKEVMDRKKFALQYVQKLARRRSVVLYSVPNQVGVVLNTINKLLYTLRPKLDAQMKSWVVYLPMESGPHGRPVYGERLNDISVSLNTKYRSLLQAIVEKLADNARLHPSTKLKRILQDTKDPAVETDVRERMQYLKTQILETISHLHGIFSAKVFVAVTRGYWDRLARDVLHFLEHRKESRSSYKSSCFALDMLDEIFSSELQRLLGNSLTEKDLEPPRSVLEARSMLSRDVRSGLDSSSYLF